MSRHLLNSFASRKIARSLRQGIVSNDAELKWDSDDELYGDNVSPSISTTDADMSYYQDRVNDWIFSKDAPPSDSSQTSSFDIEDSMELQFREMRSFLLDSLAYKWLLEKLRSVLVLGKGDTLASLRKEIREGLEDRKGKRGYNQPTYKATFNVDCCWKTNARGKRRSIFTSSSNLKGS